MNEDLEKTVDKVVMTDANSKAKAFRDALRAADAFDSAGDKRAAARSRLDAEAIWAEMQKGLVKLLARHGVSQFRSVSHPDFDDFINRLRYAVYQGLSNLSETRDIWERKFNYCLERQAVKLAMRMKESSGTPLQSLNQPVSKDEAGGGREMVDFLADPEGEMGVAWVEARDVLQWIATQLSPKHLQVVQLKMATDMTWEKIAAQCGISEKTARNYHDRAQELFISQL